jgi:hypothetical protein
VLAPWEFPERPKAGQRQLKTKTIAVETITIALRFEEPLISRITFRLPPQNKFRREHSSLPLSVSDVDWGSPPIESFSMEIWDKISHPVTTS